MNKGGATTWVSGQDRNMSWCDNYIKFIELSYYYVKLKPFIEVFC